MNQATASAVGPLAGLQVLDLTRMLAGPYCSMILADLGATVVKVEPPEGDLTRAQGPFMDDDDLHAYGGYFQSINRNKLGIVVNITTADGADVIRRLVETSDVLVENYRPGVLERYGLSYEALREINPRLVYASVRGFGDPRTGASPMQDWPSYDIVAQAMGGIMSITGDPSGPPTKIGPGVGDILPGMYAAVGILAALQERTTTGRGTFVDVAMYDAVLAVCERLVYQYSYTGGSPGREGNGHPLLSPFDVFEAADGWIAIAAPGDNHWKTLCEVLGCGELVHDKRFADNVSRVANRDAVRSVIGGWTSGLTRAEILDQLGGRVPVGPVNTAEDIYDDPHVKARGMLVEVEQPGSATPATITASPIRYAGGQQPPPMRAPLLGEHTDQVLDRLGFDETEIATLRENGAVR